MSVFVSGRNQLVCKIIDRRTQGDTWIHREKLFQGQRASKLSQWFEFNFTVNSISHQNTSKRHLSSGYWTTNNKIKMNSYLPGIWHIFYSKVPSKSTFCESIWEMNDFMHMVLINFVNHEKLNQIYIYTQLIF